MTRSKIIIIYVLFALATVLINCSNDNTVAGGVTSETTNGLTATIIHPDNINVEGAIVIAHKKDYLHNIDTIDQFSSIKDTLVSGNSFTKSNLDSGLYLIEVIFDSNYAALVEYQHNKYDVDSIIDLGVIELNKTGSLRLMINDSISSSGYRVHFPGLEKELIFENGQKDIIINNLATFDYSIRPSIENDQYVMFVEDVIVKEDLVTSVVNINAIDNTYSVIEPNTFRSDSLAVVEFLSNCSIIDTVNFDSVTTINQSRIIGLEIKNVEIPSIDKSVGTLNFLDSLVFENTKTIDVPIEISNLDSLNYLEISNGNVKLNSYSGIFSLVNISSLSLVACGIDSLSSQIGQLISLQELKLNANTLKVLPNEIVNLTNLNSIRLDYNPLDSLPENIGNLVNVNEFYCNSTNITSLPDSFGEMVNIKSLHLNSNKLSTLPSSIVNLTNITDLYVENNMLGSLTDSLIINWLDSNSTSDWKSLQR